MDERIIIPITKDGNCLFRAISYGLYGKQTRHREIRSKVVSKIVREWDNYKDFITPDTSYRLPISNAADYEKLMSLNGEFAGDSEITCVSYLFPSYTFRVYNNDDNSEPVTYGEGENLCNLLFSGNRDSGHYDVIRFKSGSSDLNSSVDSPKQKRRKKGKTLTGRREANVNRQIKKNTRATKQIGYKCDSDITAFHLGPLSDSGSRDLNSSVDSPKQKRRKKGKTLTRRREANANRQIKKNTRATKQIGYKCAISDEYSDITAFHLGPLSEKCNHCSALHFKSEKNSNRIFTLCCSNGKIKLPPFKIHGDIQHLLTGNDSNCKNFQNYIREYNSALSFVSFGVKFNMPPGIGPYCFNIQGTVHHRISDLYPDNNQSHSYGQLYILDFSEANRIRMNHPANKNLIYENLQLLNEVLINNNPYVKSYKIMNDKIFREQEEALKENRPPVNVVMRFYHEPNSDPRRYNNPTCSEVAAVFESADGAPPSHRNITVFPKQGGLKSIDYDSMHCDPLSYALVWPYGETGWHINMLAGGNRKTKIRTNVSMREYVSYRIAIRGNYPPGDFNPILNSGKLTQQLFVDYYCRIEGDRLKFIRSQQSKLRVETYIGLSDALHVRAQSENLKVGKMVILPSSFTGSPRNMTQNYQDAMAMVRKHGKPDLFITFTCNPNWPEITSSINPYEKVSNRPDVVVRVFHAKVKELMRLLTVENIFGDVKNFIYTIEFQKRGLPHLHLLLTLEDNCKIRDIADIDKVISAEIPDSEYDEDLYNLVATHMVHGPCGALNNKSVCMEGGKCKKEFPKAFVQETKENVNGYPIYRRRDDGKTITKYIHKNPIEVNNSFIVPYNPFLLKYFQAHINVELCSSVHSVKYIYKYVYKGHDCANIQVMSEDGVLNHDEVLSYLNARYVGPTEAAFRIFAYPMHDQSHTVYRLPVHLPNEQQVYFNEENIDEALLKSRSKNTQLTAWFELNKNPATKSSYIYPETPLHYVWQSSKSCWTPRKIFGNVIGRMYNVSPSDTERYHLRLLLLHVVEATSFEDLKTYQGVQYATFREAAMHRGLLLDDSEWRRCIVEASLLQMPAQLRQLFSYICIFQQPYNALQIWDDFKDTLCEDYLFSESESHVAYQLGLSDIAATLKLHGMNLSALGLPTADLITNPPQNDVSVSQNTFDNMLQKANEDQKLIITEIINLVQQNVNNATNAFFIDGPGGTGKTFLYRCLIYFCITSGYEFISVAWTGIAAMLLPKGRTVHSRFKLPLNLNETSVSNMKMNSVEASLIRKARIIIWDEAPMSTAHALECVDRLLRDIMNNDIPFGGKIILLGGDFRQVLPVVPHAARETIVQYCIKNSPLWRLFKIRRLTKNMRADQDAQDFAKFLLKIGNGEFPTVANEEPGTIELPSTIVSEKDIVSEIYGEVFNSVNEIINFSDRAILAPKNDHCNFINSKIINLIPGESKTFYSINNLITEDQQELLQYPIEFLNSLELSGLPPHELTLKVGAIVILLRNLNADQGLLNGTRLMVKQMHNNCLDLEIISGTKIGNRVLLPRLDLNPSESSFPFSFRRRQFPIRLAFCMTINKSQGQTFRKVGLYLPQPVFSHGQLYVAMSRTCSFSDLRVQIIPQGNKTVNVVFKEIL